MASSYKSFKELAHREVEGKDYLVRVHRKKSSVLVMAPHGGKIEPGTTEIAGGIAAEDHSFYSFEGLKKDGNGMLHIESHLFDEPQAVQAAEEAEVVITVHGQLDREEEFVMVGGLHTQMGSAMKLHLEAAGFETRTPPEGLSGRDPMNICNRGRLKAGVQLEISRRVRDSLRSNEDRLQQFATAVRGAIQSCLANQSD
jgi:phage replication-related protein YjqB (UPF0714/DUF867 family)